LSDTNNEETEKQSAEEIARQKNPATDWSNPRRKKERKKGEAKERNVEDRTGRRNGKQSFRV
jgi:hypothetical protein